MKTELTQEDHALLEVLDRLARHGEVALGSTLNEAGKAAEIGEGAELHTLLSYELTPEAPREEVWRAIEARLSEARLSEARLSEDGQAFDAGTLVQFPRRPVVSGELPRVPAPATVSRPTGRMIYAMAAMLGFCLLGMGYLLARSEIQRSTIDALRDDLVLAQTSSQSMRQVQDQYQMVTRTARQYYPLRPVSHEPTEKSMYGRVWVCGFHQRWLLNVERLGPAPAGYDYRFWFETPNGKVDAGVVEVEGGIGRLQDSTMPDGTTGFAMTLEPRARVGADSDGEAIELLRSEESHEILLGVEDLAGESQALSM